VHRRGAAAGGRLHVDLRRQQRRDQRGRAAGGRAVQRRPGLVVLAQREGGKTWGKTWEKHGKTQETPGKTWKDVGKTMGKKRKRWAKWGVS